MPIEILLPPPLVITLSPLFYVPLCHMSVIDWEVKRKKLLSLMESINGDFEHQADNPVKTNYHKNSQKIMPEIAQLLEPEITQFLNAISATSGTMSAAWFETASKGDWHPIHDHGAKGYSSVCYIRYNPEVHTATNFLSPFANFFTGSSMTYEPPVEEGSMIFFPSAINHYTKPNASEEERTILSFNLNVEV